MIMTTGETGGTHFKTTRMILHVDTSCFETLLSELLSWSTVEYLILQNFLGLNKLSTCLGKCVFFPLPWVLCELRAIPSHTNWRL